MALDTSGYARGADVYHGDGVIDWQQVLDSGLSFAFAKATTGETPPDPRFPLNKQGMRTVGETLGAYHWFKAGQDVDKQFDFFMTTAEPDSATLVMLDLEEDDGVQDSHVIRQGALTWCTKVQEAMGGRPPIVYTFPAFAEEHALGSALKGFPLCISDPSRYAEGELPRVPTGWKKWDFWQNVTTDEPFGGIAVPGCPGRVDSILYNGSHTALVKQFKLVMPTG